MDDPSKSGSMEAELPQSIKGGGREKSIEIRVKSSKMDGRLSSGNRVEPEPELNGEIETSADGRTPTHSAHTAHTHLHTAHQCNQTP